MNSTISANVTATNSLKMQGGIAGNHLFRELLEAVEDSFVEVMDRSKTEKEPGGTTLLQMADDRCKQAHVALYALIDGLLAEARLEGAATVATALWER